MALVTGGGTGIGSAISLELARAGADVALASRDPAHLTATAAAIGGLGRRALALAADVRDAAAVERVVSEVESLLGGLDILTSWSTTPPALCRPPRPPRGCFLCAAAKPPRGRSDHQHHRHPRLPGTPAPGARRLGESGRGRHDPPPGRRVGTRRDPGGGDLASPAASWITGATFIVDGGQRLRKRGWHGDWA